MNSENSQCYTSPLSFVSVTTCDPENNQLPSDCECGYVVYRKVGATVEQVDNVCTDDCNPTQLNPKELASLDIAEDCYFIRCCAK